MVSPYAQRLVSMPVTKRDLAIIDTFCHGIAMEAEQLNALNADLAALSERTHALKGYL